MRSTLRFHASVLGVSAALLASAGCTTSVDPMYPDVFIALDGGTSDGGSDAGLPDPTIDTCTIAGSTVGDDCVGAEDCNDGCFCNGVEVCTGGVCALGTDPCLEAPMDVECTREACLEETNTCFHMPDHSVCSNSLACDGYEQCDRIQGCVPAAPLYCNDESSCTVDSCDDTMGCVYTPRDLDGDGYLAGTCGGDDCDDDPRYGTMIYPGATEVCDNRRDDDCDGTRDYSDSDCRPMNDTCETAAVLPARTGTFSGSTAGLVGNFTLSCSTGTGPDAVFRLTLAESHDVRVAIAGITNAAVAIRPFASCAAGPDLKCSGSTTPSVLARSLPAGDYAVIVRSSTGAPFDLSLMITDPTPVPPIDVCGPTTETITASGMHRGRFEEANDDYRLSCHATGSWRDAAYRLVLAADSDVVITGTTVGSFPSTYLSLLTDCADTTSTIACQSGGTPEIRRRGLAAGTYYLLVESSDAAATEWTVNVTITTPPAPRQPGDACGTAVAIPLTAAGATETGMGTAALVGAELDSGTGCGGSAAPSRDVFFYFDLATVRDVTITTNGAGFHYVSVQEMCGVIGSEVRCRSGSGPYVQTFRSLPAGRHYIAVSTTVTTGTVTAAIETRTATAIPPNDRCTGAIDMSSGGLRFDTLTGFEDDVFGSVSGYPDAFYTFTLTERRVITLIATPTMGTPTTYLHLRASCGATTSIASAVGSLGASATLVRTLDPGTYIFFVEMPLASATDFSMRLLSDPAP